MMNSFLFRCEVYGELGVETVEYYYHYGRGF